MYPAVLMAQQVSQNKKEDVFFDSPDRVLQNIGFFYDVYSKSHSYNEDEFYDDLANSKAVVCNGGFTFITEAITLKKPIYSVPAI